jgi:hypothetical protein
MSKNNQWRSTIMIRRPIASSTLLISAVLLSACADKAPEIAETATTTEAPLSAPATVEGKALVVDAGSVKAAVVIEKSTPESAAAFIASTQVQSLTAEVVSINLETREVILKGENGIERSLVAGEDARNLAQVSPGDTVNVKFMEQVTMELVKGDNMEAFNASADRDVRSKEGEMPAHAKLTKTVNVFTIEAIDIEANTFTLKNVAEEMHEFTARDTANLEKAAIGDSVVITTTVVKAIEVTKAPETENED